VGTPKRGRRSGAMLLALSLVLSGALVGGPLSSPAGATVVCATPDTIHCYSTLDNASHQYGGLYFTQKRAFINAQAALYHVSSEGWFGNHCTGSSLTFVEVGIVYIDAFYQAFWSDTVNGHQNQIVDIANLTQNPNVSDQYFIYNTGNGTSQVQFDSFGVQSHAGSGFNGSCLQEGGEVFSNAAQTATFSITGGSYSNYPALNVQGWGTGDYGNITPGYGLMGASYSVGQWDWSAP